MIMNGHVVWEHFKELQSGFPNVTLTFENGSYYVRGEILFHAKYVEEEITNVSFLIELGLTPSYPNIPPVVKELGGRIPSTFHTFTDGTLCLGAPLAVKMTFAKNPTLMGFVKTLVIPYLYSFTYMELNKELPYGELDHGAEGVLNYYKELFQVDSDEHTLDLIYILASQSYRGHLMCPCKSGKILRKCHGPLLLKIQRYHTVKEFRIDFIDCLDFIKKRKKRG